MNVFRKISASFWSKWFYLKRTQCTMRRLEREEHTIVYNIYSNEDNIVNLTGSEQKEGDANTVEEKKDIINMFMLISALDTAELVRGLLNTLHPQVNVPALPILYSWEYPTV
jgi:hypothetical protein